MSETNFLEEIAALAGNEAMPIWEEFYYLSQIPRESKNENQAIDYIASRAKALGLEWKIDEGEKRNIVVYKPSTNGSNNTVALQSHVDMVCEKETSSNHDFLKDPIKPYVAESFVKAQGTSLGADDGIGVAVELAIMASKDMPHPNLELLFTVDEETGLNGARAMKLPLKAEYLINLDSEEVDTITVGCASAWRYNALLPGTAPTDAKKLLEISLTGFPGGHSGVQIHETKRGNPINIMGYLLSKYQNDGTHHISVKNHFLNITGGTKMNAIPRECTVLAHPETIDIGITEEVKRISENFDGAKLRVQLIDADSLDASQKMMTMHPEQLRNALSLIHSGVLYTGTTNYSPVETSNNVGVIRTTNEGVTIEGMFRSSNAFREQMALDSIVKAFKSNGFSVELDGYSGWEPKSDYRLLSMAADHGKRIIGDMKISAVHAGLECGPINGANPGMQIISIGPTIIGPHSPDEKVEIKSVGKCYELVRSLLKEL